MANAPRSAVDKSPRLGLSMGERHITKTNESPRYLKQSQHGSTAWGFQSDLSSLFMPERSEIFSGTERPRKPDIMTSSYGFK